MTPSEQPLTYERVESAMRTALARQEDLLAAYVQESDQLATAEASYKLAWASARASLRYERIEETGRFPSADAVDDEATIRVQDEQQEFLAAKAKLDATRQALTTVRTRLDTLRTLAATHRQVAS